MKIVAIIHSESKIAALWHAPTTVRVDVTEEQLTERTYRLTDEIAIGRVDPDEDCDAFAVDDVLVVRGADVRAVGHIDARGAFVANADHVEVL